jgi:hypothetical protein
MMKMAGVEKPTIKCYQFEQEQREKWLPERTMSRLKENPKTLRLVERVHLRRMKNPPKSIQRLGHGRMQQVLLSLNEERLERVRFVIMLYELNIILTIAPENVNADPVVSPKKATTKPGLADEKQKSKKPSFQAPKEPTKPKPRVKVSRTAPETIELPSSHSPDIIDTTEITPESKMELQPKTPAPAPDLFSPPSTEPSTARPLGPRDTPPPTDLQSSANGIDLNGGRRRARVQVNYAEPSLNSKMRRPTKELCDAVGKDGKPLSVTGMGNRVTIKTESGEDREGWKSLPPVSTRRDDSAPEPGSPLSKKSSLVPSRISTTNEGGEESRNEQDIHQGSEPPAAISAFLRDARTKKSQSAGGTAKAPESASQRPSKDSKKTASSEDEKRSSLAIFDFTSSSPPRDIANPQRPDSREGVRVSSRRHSSISALTSMQPKVRSGERTGKGTSSTAPSTSSAAQKHKRQISVDSAATTGPIVSELEALSQSAGVGRSERAAARRRSMML